MRTRPAAFLVSLALAGIFAAPLIVASSAATATAGRPRPAMPSDFDGDGYADLAIGVPAEAVGSTNYDAGAVNVLYGSATGLTAAGDQYWTQNSPGVKGVSLGLEEDQGDEGPFDWFGDRFGDALASGDFDRDGYADLAIGVPGDWVGSSMDAGAVNVLYGTATGLTASGDQYWTGVGLAQQSLADRVGWALAAGDFDGDGYYDLAIGSVEPTEEPTGSVEATVLYGSPGGLATVGATSLAPVLAGPVGWPKVTLAAGDLDGDGLADLAVGHMGALVGEVSGAGGVGTFYGTQDGLTAAGSQIWTQDSPGIEDEAEDGDGFGGRLTIGDFDADGFGDLAVGVPWETTTPCCEFDGAASILYGSGGGLTAEGNQLWHQDVPGVPGVGGQGSRFASSLATGDFNGDGADDLAIGVPHESTAAGLSRGAVITLYGGTGGLSASGAQRWTQDSAGVPGNAEDFDGFGASLAGANYGRSRRDDLAIGVPGEEFRSCARYCPDPGVVDVLYGRASGLSGTNAQVWSQNSAGVKGTAERGDNFGSTLAR